MRRIHQKAACAIVFALIGTAFVSYLAMLLTWLWVELHA